MHTQLLFTHRCTLTSLFFQQRLFRLDSKEENLLLGAGKYGIVHRVEYHNKWHAGKTIYETLYTDDSDCWTTVTMACNKFLKLSHSNVEAFVAVEINRMENIPMLLTELFPENLNELVDRCKSNLAFYEQLSIITNMADGLDYLHHNGIIHTNLHGGNVLINYEHQAKIGDFVCPQLLQAGVIHVTTAGCGNSQAFVAPELQSVEKLVHSMESDIFALGVLFLQVFMQEIPTAGNNLISKLDDCHPFQPLVYSCISEEKESRPECADVCKQLAHDKDSSQCIMYNCLYGKKVSDLDRICLICLRND